MLRKIGKNEYNKVHRLAILGVSFIDTLDGGLIFLNRSKYIWLQ